MTTIARRDSYIWVTWLTSVLAGDAQCAWAPWFKAHYKFDKVERDSQLDEWKAQHQVLVEARVEELRAAGWQVWVEDQNAFTMRGRVATLAGKPDIVAVRAREALVIDCKTGKRRNSDLFQVFLYLFALPLTHVGIAEGMRLVGQVQYRDGTLEVPVERLTPDIRRRILDTINRVGGAAVPARVPSARECRFCEIGRADCSDRVEQGTPEVTTTDAF